jgi:hypothetical protein
LVPDCIQYLEHGADGLQFFVVKIFEDEGCHRRNNSDEEVRTRQRHEGRARGGSEINYTKTKKDEFSRKRTKKTGCFLKKKNSGVDKKKLEKKKRKSATIKNIGYSQLGRGKVQIP